MQNGNKVLRGLGDKLIEENKWDIKCHHSMIYHHPSFWFHT